MTLLDPLPAAPQRRLAKPEPVYTIGHSTRTIVEFVELLRIGNVELVVDIRSVPRSRTNPQFNLDALPEALASWQIGHTQIKELGGLRGKSKTVSVEVNGFWNNQSFHKLRRLCIVRRVSHRLVAPAGTESGSAVLDHVFRSRLVAMPPTDRC